MHVVFLNTGYMLITVPKGTYMVDDTSGTNCWTGICGYLVVIIHMIIKRYKSYCNRSALWHILCHICCMWCSICLSFRKIWDNPVFDGVGVAQSLVFYDKFCILLFVLWSFPFLFNPRRCHILFSPYIKFECLIFFAALLVAPYWTYWIFIWTVSIFCFFNYFFSLIFFVF